MYIGYESKLIRTKHNFAGRKAGKKRKKEKAISSSVTYIEPCDTEISEECPCSHHNNNALIRTIPVWYCLSHDNVSIQSNKRKLPCIISEACPSNTQGSHVLFNWISLGFYDILHHAY